MAHLLRVVRTHRLLWLLVLVPLPLIGEHAFPERQSLFFVLSIAAIISLAGLLSIATEAVATKRGDAVGGLLNATLGNLTELIISLAALRAGEYLLVKASLAGAIVANTLFMMGACLLIGGQIRARPYRCRCRPLRKQVKGWTLKGRSSASATVSTALTTGPHPAYQLFV